MSYLKIVVNRHLIKVLDIGHRLDIKSLHFLEITSCNVGDEIEEIVLSCGGSPLYVNELPKSDINQASLPKTPDQKKTVFEETIDRPISLILIASVLIKR